VELRDAGGREIDTVLAEPTALVLLVYLATVHPAVRHRYDTLRGLFWPHLDDAAGRDELCRGLGCLREGLGAGVLSERGADEVAIDPMQLSCDAAEFRDAVAAGRLADAMELYHGDFLADTPIHGLGNFAEWVVRERGALRDMGAQCARQLADEQESRGHVTKAMYWSRRQLEADPDDERAVRHALALYERAGNRAGALHLYHEFTRRLAEQYGSDPSPETRVLYERVRSGEHANPSPSGGAPSALEGSAPAGHPATTPAEDDVVSFQRRYRIDREIGAGGMAVVYLAHDLKHDREVAIKELRTELAAELARERFDREIRIASMLQHPNIVPLFDSGEVDGRLYFVMPYIHGPTLRARLKDEGHLAISQVLHLMRELTDALAYAHAEGVIHRDIKPENIMLIGERAVLADFGIARAVHAARTRLGTSGETLTELGIRLGTPAYMAPEQVVGSPDIDHRADLYAMGIVAYEMLAGRPPFVGKNADEVLAAQVATAPRRIEELCPEVPPALAEIVMLCLEKAPDGRPSSAGEVSRLLDTVVTPPGRPFPRRARTQTERERAFRQRRAAAVVAGVAFVFTALLIAPRVSSRADGTATAVPPDTTHLVVLPVEHDGSGMGRTIDDDLLYEALSRWSGVVLVDQFQVVETIRRKGDLRPKGSTAALVTGLGAGRYVRTRVSAMGDSMRVYAALYDVVDERPVFQVSAQISSEVGSASRAYCGLARSLLLQGAGGDSLPFVACVRRSLPAVQAYVRAHAALSEWNLSLADSSFQTAVAFDPSDARANLWLAQVRAWRGMSPASWATLAERAIAGAANLSVRERTLADALAGMARDDFEGACGSYEELRRVNDHDFNAWFGLGQCRGLDKTVVRDASSPSGWRMRSSYRRAVDAYVRAFALLPSVYSGYEHDSFDQLRGLLLVGTDLITAYQPGKDSALFQARPALLGDTLALVPYPWREVASGDPGVIPPRFTDALDQQRAEFRRLAAGWSAAFPRRAGPKQALAIALELLNDPTAIDTLHLARSLARDSTHARQYAAQEVLLRVKFALPLQLAPLRGGMALADSLLGVRAPSPAEARALAPVAAISGRCALGEQLARRADMELGGVDVPPDLAADAQALLMRASLGCADSWPRYGVAELAAAIARERDRGRVDIQNWLELALLYRPLLLSVQLDSVVVDRLAVSSGDLLLNAARAYTRHDTAQVRARLSAFHRQWRDALGAPSPDIVFPGARLLAAIGDTAAAIGWLDQTLNGVRSYDPRELSDQALAAALVRSMVLRADLAAATGDASGARRWGAAVAVLWSGADRQLQPVLGRMMRYAGQP
jgi:DNA-binding SARP family transcriptional activator/tetratricopeptide (TPR) repeat protein/predicted Ser/Thr protein kinase